jgi:hypothetical protein
VVIVYHFSDKKMVDKYPEGENHFTVSSIFPKEARKKLPSRRKSLSFALHPMVWKQHC